jgi:predicted small secreted protein
MSNQVWKYLLQPETEIELSAKSIVLSANEQFGDIYIWIVVDPDPYAYHIKRVFEVYGTGHSISKVEDLKFIDTVMLNNGAFVFHVFERVESTN